MNLGWKSPSMTSDDWVHALRKRSHDLSNFVQMQEARLVRFDERQTQIGERVRQLEEIAKTVNDLRHQARVLKWLLGVATAAAVGILVKLS